MRALGVILAVALVTLALRILPVYLLGRKGKALSPGVLYLTEHLPGAVIALLVVYSLKSLNFLAAPFGLPELAAAAAAALLQHWKRNTLLSVSLSTALYMVLIRVI